MSSNDVAIRDASIDAQIVFGNFASRSFRAFQLPLKGQCEDYGQAVVYRGKLAGHSHSFTLDDHHVCQKGKVVPAYGKPADMLR